VKLTERLTEDKAHSLDRRKISDESVRHIAEAIHYDNTDAALRRIFEVLTGDTIDQHPPIRDIKGEIIFGKDVSLKENQIVVVEVGLGEETDQTYVDGEEDRYSFREYEEGKYTLSASVVEVREYDMDTLESTRYEVSDSSISLSSKSVTVDPQSVTLGTDVLGPTVTIDSLTIGSEITEEQ